MRLSLLSLALFGLLFLTSTTGCNSADNCVTLRGELKIDVLQAGVGRAVQTGNLVTVAYIGRLENGTVFDEGTISFNMGTRQVIQGWEDGLMGARIGEKRRLTIPPNLGYGCRDAGCFEGTCDIPGNSVLIFEVEVLDVGN